MSIFVIAEAGVNHNGNLYLAKKLIDVAVECGADAIKFQIFKAYESTGTFANKAEYQIENMSTNESQYEMIKNLELSFQYFQEIKEYCNKRDIMLILTPDGEESLNFLMELEPPFIKVGSTEITNHMFLSKIAKKGKSIILSTGMSKLGEIEEALDIIYSENNTEVIIMQCTTDYPTKYEDVNLRAMVTMKSAFNTPVGFSDHTISSEAAIAAVALGATFIEKHITLSRDMEGPDHRASMPPNEFREYVKSIRNTEVLLGDGIKKPTEREDRIMKDVRRSIVASTDLDRGAVIDERSVNFKRPGNGINPKYFKFLEGKKLKRNLKKDELISWEDI